jgi:hypothetical protein
MYRTGDLYMYRIAFAVKSALVVVYKSSNASLVEGEVVEATGSARSVRSIC